MVKDTQRTNSAQVGPHELRAQADHIEETTDLKGTALLLREAADTIEAQAKHIAYVEETAIANGEQAKVMLAERDAEVERLRAVIERVKGHSKIPRLIVEHAEADPFGEGWS